MDTLTHALSVPEGFNSDDESDGPNDERPPTTQKVIGERTCLNIFANATKDRKRSRAAWKNHKSTALAPTTQYQRDLWRQYYKAFALTLAIPETTCPTSETLYRFVETIVQNINARIPGKPAMSKNTLLVGLASLNRALSEEYEGFQISAFGATRMDSLINRLVKEGRLIQGVWKEKVFMGIATIRKMALGFMRDALEKGTRSWDTTILKLTSILVIAALGSRPGDVVRSTMYTDMEVLTWEDLTLKLKEGGDSAKDLTIDVKLRFVKGYKHSPGENRLLPLTALSEPNQNILCPVKLLVILAMRTGAIEARNFSELVGSMTRMRDRTARWKYPKRPVFPRMMRKGGWSRLDIDRSAPVSQVQSTVREMGGIAGIVARLDARSLRYGAARDMANLGESIAGAATMDVAQQLGHSMKTFLNDVTASYIGGSTADVYSMRVENDYYDPRAPQQAYKPFNKAEPLNRDEFEVFAKGKYVDLHDPVQRNRAYYAFRQKRFDDYLQSAANEEVPLSEPTVDNPIKQRLQTTSVKIKSAGASSLKLQTSLETPDASTNASNASVASHTPRYHSTSANFDPESVLFPHELLEGNSQESIVETYHASGIPIDPEVMGNQLIRGLDGGADRDKLQTSLNQSPIDEDEDSDAVESTNASNEASDILDVMFGEGGPPTQEADLHDSILTAAFDKTTLRDTIANEFANDPLLLPPAEFINFFCAINVVANPHKSDDWVPMVDTESCQVSVTKPPPEKAFICSICSAAFKTKKGLTAHDKSLHSYSKLCQYPGCPDKTVYMSAASYRKHQETHSWDSSTTCLVPGCDFTRTFETKDGYRSHLIYHHKMNGKSTKAYMPQVETEDPRKWNRRLCMIEGCGERLTGRLEFLNHLTDVEGHGLSDEDASNKLEELLHKSEEAKQKKAEKRKLREETDAKIPWGTRRCFMPGCSTLTKGRNVMLRHLMNPEEHGLQESEANTRIDEMLRLAKEEKAKKANAANMENENEPALKKHKVQRNTPHWRSGSARKH
ncbi:hypothetical protein SLS54_004246 [Diplodia seriata]